MAEPVIYYTPEQLAELLNVTVTTIYNYLRRGTLHGAKLGNLWRVPASELARLMRPHEPQPAPGNVRESREHKAA